jgi:hypothetical protein
MTNQTDIIGLVKELDNQDMAVSALLIAMRTLEDISKMQAEDNFKSWKDKVNDVQTWQEEFFNQVILKPVNEHAEEALSRIRSLPIQS